jgi:hypothetical protein
MGGESSSGVFVPCFGYYVGPAERIESKVNGVVVQARLAKWSQNPSVVAFWFPQDVVPDENLLGIPQAYDAKGNVLTR